MKRKTLISRLALGFLTLMMLTVPALAQYNVTLTLWVNGEQFCTKTFEDVDNMTLTVPEPLYLMIVGRYETDTFTAPFNVTLPFLGPGGAPGIVILEVTSAPPGWTVTFEPMTLPDVAEPYGVVDVYDLVKVAGAITVNPGKPDNYDMFLDLNFDLTIDIFDLVKVAKHIGIP